MAPTVVVIGDFRGQHLDVTEYVLDGLEELHAVRLQVHLVVQVDLMRHDVLAIHDFQEGRLDLLFLEKMMMRGGWCIPRFGGD